MTDDGSEVKKHTTLSEFTYKILTEIWFNREASEGYLGHRSAFSVLDLVWKRHFKDMVIRPDCWTEEQRQNLKELMLQTADDFPEKIMFRLAAKRLRALADQV